MSNTPSWTRRAWLARMVETAAGGAVLLATGSSLVAAQGKPIAVTVYKDPGCECCTKWADYLRKNGFAVDARNRSDMDELKDSLGVPATLRSCHTAVLGRYVIEGHVPAVDIKRLVSTAPKTILGLAVPNMPHGSPGMETGGPAHRYDVVAFAPGGRTQLFARH